ncbi:hypothetical protein P7C71_g726, partial [Lecanoromycetidae sp. Uapishka_2]
MGAPVNSPAVQAAIASNNLLFSYCILIVLGTVVVSIAIYGNIVHSVQYLRTLTCLNNDRQKYFKLPNTMYGCFKQHLLYAPLFTRRHSKQMRIGPIEMGILPGRFQAFLLAGIFTMEAVLWAYGIEWHGPIMTLLQHLGNRAGTLAVVNMIPLVVLAGRNNPLIGLLNISYDNFNLMHRWFGRIVVALAVSHGVAEIMSIVVGQQMHEKAKTPGIVIFSATLKEKEAHFIIFGVVRFIRLASLLYRNVGRNGTQAHVEALPGDALRVTFLLARPWKFFPGQHIFLTMPSVGLWTSHPFSVAWSEAIPQSYRHPDPEKGYTDSIPQTTDILALPQTSISLVIRRRGGFTERLYRRALSSNNGRVTLSALIEGPYGGTQNLQSYGTVMLFAGGVGIMHQIPFVRDLIASYASGTSAVRRIVLIWVIQSPEHLEWIRPWMTMILAMPKRRDVLRIQLFVTRPRSSKEIHSPSSTVQMFPGKPNVDALVEMESRDQVGAMAVSVCGPGGLGDDVRCAARRRQTTRNIDFFEEGFGW